jgi:hypothetical protein
MCHHTDGGQGLSVRLTDGEGQSHTQLIDGNIRAFDSGVPYKGTWTYGVDDFEDYYSGTFTITAKGSGIQGVSADGRATITLKSNGKVDIEVDGVKLIEDIPIEALRDDGTQGYDGRLVDIIRSN